MRVYGLVQDSIVDGPGLRFVVFVQGCSHHCPGCHNPESQPHEGGTEYTVDQLYDMIRANGLVRAVTLSGGEPFEQAQECAELARRLKQDDYNIWAYTGYLHEDLKARAEAGDEAIAALLANIDTLVDGPFIEAQHSFDLPWRGSSNQRIIEL